MHIYGLFVIILSQAISTLIFRVVLRDFAEKALIFKITVLIVICCAAIDIYFLIANIIIPKTTLNKAPIKCHIEDIMLIGYRNDDRIKYEPFPIVRSLANNKLYFAYGNYSLMGFKHRIVRIGNTITECALYNETGDSIGIGDTVNVYILKEVNPSVAVNSEKNTVKLNQKKCRFIHINEQIDISVFERITYFKGVVDLDTDACNVN